MKLDTFIKIFNCNFLKKKTEANKENYGQN